ncbi:MAG: NAD-dependent deacylase [Deltaproteobacteria bacterium RBG_13_52_11]|nr:MAG: NAD-dependent deacylase [Deltaproteobacteria bacterium RBG_13_52_11]
MRTVAMELIDSVIAAFDRAKKIVVLTGAGISAESGVPTFRGEDGLWRRYRAEELATPAAFEANPQLVWEWYDWRRGIIGKAEPNPGHKAIAEMERIFPSFSLITQNVDGLHRRAGNTRIIEIHGNLWQLRCVREGRVREDYCCPLPEIPPLCECGALLRPHVVWFGESLDQGDLARAYSLIEECDLLLVVGTSAVVQPVSSFPLMAKQGGAFVVEVNMDPTPLSSFADASLQGKAGEVLPALLKKIKGAWGL